MQPHEARVGMEVLFGRAMPWAEKSRGTIVRCNKITASIESKEPRGRKGQLPPGTVFKVPYEYVEPITPPQVNNPFRTWITSRKQTAKIKAAAPRKPRSRNLPLMETVQATGSTRLVTFCELNPKRSQLKDGVTLVVKATHTLYDDQAKAIYAQSVRAMDEEILPAISHALDTLYLLQDCKGRAHISDGILTLEDGTTIDLNAPAVQRRTPQPVAASA